MNITRRHALWSASALSVAALAACATMPTLPQVATDARSIADALSATVPAILKEAGVPTDLGAKLTGDLAAVKTAADNLAAEITPSTTTVRAILAAVQDIAAAVATIAGLPPNLVMVVNAAVALLPVLAGSVGIAMAAKPVMSADQARLILLAAAK